MTKENGRVQGPGGVEALSHSVVRLCLGPALGLTLCETALEWLTVALPENTSEGFFHLVWPIRYLIVLICSLKSGAKCFCGLLEKQFTHVKHLSLTHTTPHYATYYVIWLKCCLFTPRALVSQASCSSVSFLSDCIWWFGLAPASWLGHVSATWPEWLYQYQFLLHWSITQQVQHYRSRSLWANIL